MCDLFQTMMSSIPEVQPALTVGRTPTPADLALGRANNANIFHNNRPKNRHGQAITARPSIFSRSVVHQTRSTSKHQDMRADTTKLPKHQRWLKYVQHLHPSPVLYKDDYNDIEQFLLCNNSPMPTIPEVPETTTTTMPTTAGGCMLDHTLRGCSVANALLVHPILQEVVHPQPNPTVWVVPEDPDVLDAACMPPPPLSQHHFLQAAHATIRQLWTEVIDPQPEESSSRSSRPAPPSNMTACWG